MPSRPRGASCIFWMITLGTVMTSVLYASVCIISLTGVESGMCPVLETTTIVCVIAFVLVMFWYCFKLQTTALTRPSNFVIDPTSISTEHVNNVRYTCASPLVREEYFSDILKPLSNDVIPEDFECAICNEGREESRQVIKLKCHHYFHKTCIIKWFTSNKHKTCPVCRTSQIPTNHLMVITILPNMIDPETSRPFRVSQL